MRFRRASLGLSQDQLAQKANLSPGFIANIETGRNFPSSNAILKIASAMKVDPWKLFVDPQKQELFFSRDEVDQWLADSRKRLLGQDPIDGHSIYNDSLAEQNEYPDED